MNFGLRLDEILETLNNKAREERASCTERNNWEGYNSAYEKLEYEAKQAIASLMKEMVAEAKPYKKPQFFCQGCDKSEERGHNHAIDEFEQNLLKALEEV